ncbi:MAG: hypothetical protein QM706_03025 [Nitrospira sp.]
MGEKRWPGAVPTRSAPGAADGVCKLEQGGHFLQRHSSVRWDIGFTDSSNPFYLFSKLNTGLLLWAPFASTMREEYPLLIALRGGWVDAHAKNRNRRTGGRVEAREGARVSLCRTDHRRSTGRSQIVQS